MEPTKNQQLAIDIRDSNVLVSAAAGSGKTSVLVERIIGRITSETDPVDVDRMLIMTFTNAAAAEMKERIREAIDAAGLERQSLLVHGAMITTIHGFCKSVITDHFEKVDIDPNYRIADENECKLLMQEALAQCLEEGYEKADPAYLAATECFSSAKNDTGFENLIIPIYEFLSADPDPEEYARRCCRFYEYATFEDFTDSELVHDIEAHFKTSFSRLVDGITRCEELIDDYPDIAAYKANIDAYNAAFTAIEKKLSENEKGENPRSAYDIIREGLAGIDAPSFSSIRDSKLDEAGIEAKHEVAGRRDAVKSGVATLLAMAPFDLKTSFMHICASKEHIEALVDTVLSFAKLYSAKKHEANVIDFNDMEHLAVKILKDPDIAATYRDRFAEVYVDEYQDTNATQEMLVNLICRKNPGNVFQVGDVKQSIYSFRQARPDIFLGKYYAYSDEEGAGDRRILLNENFRSRHEVTDAVNEVFSAIMKADFGGIEYTYDASLKFAATYYEEADDKNDPYRCEIVIGERGELSKEEACANIVASRIASMVRDGVKVYDKAKKITRPVTFGDFTVLVRSIRKFDRAFREVFAGAGIPLAVSGSEGYFTTVEVRTALAFLSAVDNPLCDIPLAAFLLSPVGDLTDEDLAKLTAAEGNKTCLYDRIRKAAQSDEEAAGVDEELRSKCKAAIDMLRKYRVMSTYMPVRDILSHFIDNEYGDYVKCMNKGSQRMANLKALLAKAEEFGRTSFKGLYSFVRYMELIRKYEIDDGEAATGDGSDDAVKLMTIHGSKGLEFPVCFVVGIDRRRNTVDEGGAVIRNQKSGFGIDYHNLSSRVVSPTLVKTFIKLSNIRDSVAEEMRILYVAMTRAREKLIMVGCGDADTFEAPPKAPGAFMSYLDMLIAARPEDGFKHIDIKYVTEKDLVGERFDNEIEREGAAEELLAVARWAERGEAKSSEEKIPTHLSHVSDRYPYPLNPELRPKLSVTDIKMMAMERIEAAAGNPESAPEDVKVTYEKTPDRYIPRFAREEGETVTGGTFYGSAFHRIMELWDYPPGDRVSSEEVRAFAASMLEQRRIEREQADAIDPDDVAAFLNSPLGARMQTARSAGKLYREQPFVIGVPESGEMILVQGIVDAYFIEDDGITIVDYKTDRVRDGKELIDRYRTQLEYYAKALSQITGARIKALIIYSTRLRREIVIA